MIDPRKAWGKWLLRLILELQWARPPGRAGLGHGDGEEMSEKQEAVFEVQDLVQNSYSEGTTLRDDWGQCYRDSKGPQPGGSSDRVPCERAWALSSGVEAFTLGSVEAGVSRAVFRPVNPFFLEKHFKYLGGKSSSSHVQVFRGANWTLSELCRTIKIGCLDTEAS